MTQTDSMSPGTLQIPDPLAAGTRNATALLVLGMHRSGTSALSRLLNLLGVELGSDLLPPAADNETGFWEHREIQFIHDRIYEDLQAEWTHVSPLPDHWWERPGIQKRRQQLKEELARDFGNYTLWGIKDPRLCSMLPLWRPLLDELHCKPKCVLIFRNPLEVVRSLVKRDKISESRAYLLWLRSVIESEQYSRDLPRALTTFERILSDWQGQFSQIGRTLEIHWPTPIDQVTDAVSEFIRPSARHHRVEDDSFLADNQVPQQVRRLYAAVLAAVESGHTDQLSVVVDKIAEELAANQPLLVQFVRDLQAETRTIAIERSKDAIRFSGEIGELNQQMTAANADHADQLASAQQEFAAQTQSFTQQFNQVTEKLAASAQELQQSLTHAAEITAQSDALRETITQKNQILDKLRAQQIDGDKQITKLTSGYRQLRNELDEAYRIRDALGVFLRSFWKSKLWMFARPAWLLARALGKLDRGIDQLIPLTDARRTAHGSWEGNAVPLFLIPTAPLIGWVRVRAKLTSSVSSKASLYFDSGSAFNEPEHVELAMVAGNTEIDRMVLLRKPAYLLRFDSARAPGEYVVHSFSLQPISTFWFVGHALLRNLKTAFIGGPTHRPSIWLGLKLLFSGDWSIFHRQLINNAEITAAVTEYDLWLHRHEITDESRGQMRETIAGWQNPPKISIIMPVYNVPEIYLRKCIDSVLKQIYPNWELCIADDASPLPHIKDVLKEYALKDQRIKVAYQPVNGGISVASNAALKLATGEFIALLDHDDEIAEHALFSIAQVIVQDPSVDMIYSDEDKITAADKRHDPFFKPDWSPEYFLACMYTCHLGVYRTKLINDIGGWRKQFDGAQDYDLVLRVIAANAKVHHIPDVLYHWRTLPSSTASHSSAKPQAHFRAQDAIQDYLEMTGKRGTVEDGPSSGFHRVRFAIQGDPKVSIVIPSACRPIDINGRQTWLALECVSSIRRLSTYKNLEIIVLDDNNMSDELTAALGAYDVRRIPFTEPFNFSSKMNLGCFAALGTHLVTMNDDVEVISPDWIECMLEYSQQPEIGAVGAHLLFPDNTHQHTGVTILEGNPGHPFYSFPADHPGYFNSAIVHRNWSAVTAACMMTRADAFKSVGGFTESFPLNYNDVDYCLKLRSTGKRIVYTPYAKLYHHESVTKSGTYAHELEDFKKTWSERFPRDPYYNPNLSLQMGDFRIG
jgi:O-antigen biosynthesis protein